MALLKDIIIIPSSIHFCALTYPAWFITPHPNTVCHFSHFDNLIHYLSKLEADNDRLINHQKCSVHTPLAAALDYFSYVKHLP